jgi:ribonuclease M5
VNALIKLNMPIIVEGKYDKITLENVVDTLIITTNGFSIFKDKEKCALIKLFAKRDGIIVLTDSDSAGNMIRNHIKNIVADGKIFNVYIPQIKGKEKRKAVASKEGFLGVEGLSKQQLAEAFEKSGVIVENTKSGGKKITKTDMYFCGLSGRENATENRKKLLEFLNLPKNLSANAVLDVLNTILTFEEFEKAVEECLKPQDKN